MEKGVIVSSSGSVVEISRSKRRYVDLDNLLKGFIGCSGFTAKEIAVEVLGWSNERYSNAPKRCHDLHLRGYLELMEGRVCRQTGKVAHTYCVTHKGLDYLRGKGFVVPVEHPVEINNPVNVTAVFSDIKSLLS